MKRYRVIVAAGFAAGGLFAGGALAPGASSAPVAHAAACRALTNIEAIVDDSGSMAVTDKNKLRVQGLDLLIDALPSATSLGAVEFGGSFRPSTPSADTVFAPAAVGPNGGAMKAALKQKINADNGLTDYNAAFAQAKADNPNAQARIFLTDGGHDAGPYNNGHAPGPPTYVVGFGSATGGTDGARLQKIASDTGGKYFPQTDSSNLQAVMNQVGSIVACQSLPVRYADTFSRTGQVHTHAYTVPRGFGHVNVTASWSDPSSKFNLVLVGTGYRAGAARLHVRRRAGTTYVLLSLTGVPRGRLKFKVRANRLGTARGANRVTTQVTRSRR